MPVSTCDICGVPVASNEKLGVLVVNEFEQGTQKTNLLMNKRICNRCTRRVINVVQEVARA